MHNPLLADILILLKRSPAGISEYAIHQALAEHEHIKTLSDNSQLAMFKKHFMVMNALYQLKQQLWQNEQCVLNISPLNITLTKTRNTTSKNNTLTENETLSVYYLDESNYTNTNEAEVNKLLDGFWQRFVSNDERHAALNQLDLDGDATHHQIEQRYRQLIAQHHPDRGGQQQDFVSIRKAYEALNKS